MGRPAGQPAAACVALTSPRATQDRPATASMNVSAHSARFCPALVLRYGGMPSPLARRAGRARGPDARTFAAGACVARARRRCLTRPRAGDKVPDEAASIILWLGSVRPGAPGPGPRAAGRKLETEKGEEVRRRCRLPRWRGAFPSDTMHPRRGTARWVEWLSYSRTRADGRWYTHGGRHDVRHDTDVLGFVFPVEPAAAGRALPTASVLGFFRKALATGQ